MKENFKKFSVFQQGFQQDGSLNPLVIPRFSRLQFIYSRQSHSLYFDTDLHNHIFAIYQVTSIVKMGLTHYIYWKRNKISRKKVV